ncbi:hypothetical protein B296_00007592 [Ensete ventricosum]|uniref:Uncharacterized protein n=1 Tax=Ensete ventricosum TaxID=4639 RepID=A0A427B929_ENSVE|nr:hypothetical protein B296_00007592 [Ensete ventricosum]
MMAPGFHSSFTPVEHSPGIEKPSLLFSVRSRAAAAAVVAVRVVAGASAADAYNGCEVVEVDEPAAPWSVDVTSIHCFQQSKQYCPSDNVDQQRKISVNSDGGTPSSLLSEFNRKIKAWKPK